MNKIIKIVFTFLLSSLLVSCAVHDAVVSPVATYKNASTPVKGAIVGGTGGAIIGASTFKHSLGGFFTGGVVGALVGASIGAYLDAHRDITEKLEARHVKVLRVGEQVKLVIDKNQLFSGEGDRILSSGESTLDNVVALIRPLTKVSVVVTAYGAMPDSDAQAHAVANYIWSQHSDIRLLLAEGREAGEHKRIEIRFRDLSGS